MRSNRRNFVARTTHYSAVFYSVSHDIILNSESMLIYQIKMYILDY